MQANSEVQDRLFAVLRSETDPKALEQKLRAVIHDGLAKFPEEDRKRLGDPDTFEKAQVAAMLTPGLRSIIQSDPAKTLRKLKCPVLAMNGALDLQVSADANLPAAAAALSEAGNADYTIVKLPGLNHLFQTAKTGAVTEYAAIEETFSPGALQVLSEWIARHVK